jgi:hypothetical protein
MVESEMAEGEVVKRGPGRPKKNPEAVIARDPKRPMFQVTTDYENIDPTSLNIADKMHIPPEEIPEDVVFVWASLSTNGRPEDQNIQAKGRAGWCPVMIGDCDGRFDQRWDRKKSGEQVTYEGNCGLMWRPKVLHEKAKARELKEARLRLAIKEQQFRGGDIPGIGLDAGHPSAVGSNRINKSYERIDIPEK